jgi:hypothetical protein
VGRRSGESARERPGVGGALLGVGLPALVSVTAVRLGGGSWVAAVSWAIASVVTTGLVLVLLILFVAYVVRPA